MPTPPSAKDEAAMSSLHTFITKIETQIINPIITLIMLAAFLVFVWGVVEFIMGAGEEEKRRKGRMHILWGIIGLVIMFGAQVILQILKHVVGAK